MKSSRKGDRTRYPLPDPVDDGSRICVKLYIPNIDGHRQALIGAIYNLTRWYSWAQDDAKTGREVAAVWQPIFYDMMENFYDGCPDDNPCFTFPPSAPFIEWFPNNPYTEPDLVTEGYNSPAWYEATPASNLILGTQNGDIVTDLSRFPPGSLPSIIPASGLPRFRINLVAPGVVTIHLLNIIAGSLAQITIDDDIGTLRFIDMNRDQIAAPFETATTTPVEVEVLGAGAHHIDVIVVSQVNDEIPFLYHGGGLRKIEICGEAADMPYFELRQDPDDPCLVQQRLTATGEWIEAFRMDNCCDDDTPLQVRYSPSGEYETSPDGETWAADPARDPRESAPQAPPLGGAGDSTKCASADNVRALFVQYRDDLIALLTGSTTVLAIVAAIVGFIGAVLGISGAATGIGVLMIGLATFLLSATPESVEEQIDDEALDAFRCILYCHAQENGQYTYEDWQAILADIAEQFTGFPETFFYQTVAGMGRIGLSNAGAAGPATASDCDECDCENFCSEKYRIFDDNPVHGTILEYGSNYIIAQCTGTHLTLQAIDYNDCCYVNSAETLSGGTVLSAFELCGSPPVPPWIGATPIGNCCSIIECQVAGTIKIYLDDCP